LLEGGAGRITTCEDDPHWEEYWRPRFPDQVEVVRYTWANPLSLGFNLDYQSWDLALIDGPRLTWQRPAVVDFCVRHCGAVLVPLEEGDGARPLREAVLRVAAKYQCDVEYLETGPLAGTFVVLT
jgi:hypothetical protein